VLGFLLASREAKVVLQAHVCLIFIFIPSHFMIEEFTTGPCLVAYSSELARLGSNPGHRF
jgi:hypothetical protein